MQQRPNAGEVYRLNKKTGKIKKIRILFPNLKQPEHLRIINRYMRKPRHLLQGSIYHVIARVNRQEFILHSAEIKELFIAVLRQAKKKFKFELRNFVLMSNHIHMMIKPGEKENLSRIMQWILSVFAMRYNRKQGCIGHVWYDRFKSFIINNYRLFLKVFYYIADNPVKAGLAKQPEAYAYSGVSFLIRGIHDIIHPPDLSIMILPLKVNQLCIADRS